MNEIAPPHQRPGGRLRSGCYKYQLEGSGDGRQASPALRKLVIEMVETPEAPDWLTENILGKSDAIRQLRLEIRRVARTDLPVFVTGETGVGKTLVARGLHALSNRSGAPLVYVNMAAMPDSLVSAELFGVEKGAFTGASSRAGLLESADSGTVVLDELPEIPKEMQSIFLRFLETGSFRRLGAGSERHIDVRVVSLSNRSLESLVDSERVSEALLYRLAGVVISVPPLRERRSDISVLVDYFVKELSTEGVVRDHLSFTSEALALIERYDFPGNIRELQNLVRIAALQTKSGVVGPEHLEVRLLQRSRPTTEIPALRQQLEIARAELDLIRSSSISASPIWEGRFFPAESDYCFVLMPFSEEHDLQRVFAEHVKAVIETRCGLRCERADDIYGISGVMQSVWEGINRARLIVAELTGRNPNVFYELGIAHTLGKPVIMLTQSMDFVPFDLRHLRCIVYNYKPNDIKRFEMALERTVRTVLSSTANSSAQQLRQET